MIWEEKEIGRGDHSIIHENGILGTERVLNMNYSNKKAKKDKKIL
mgnify:FL=1